MEKQLPRCAAAMVLAFASGVQHPLAAAYVCETVRRGETAARIGHRLTGHPDGSYQPWFQIFDPARSRAVPKSQYRRILPGWRACVVSKSTLSKSTVSTRSPSTGAASTSTTSVTTAIRANRVDGSTLERVRLPMAWWLALAFELALGVWYVATRYLAKRQATVAVMTRFGEKFVREFEQPLMQPGAADRALRARLRCIPRKGQVEILISPNQGHRYPNLSDHRKNVEYDVARVLEQLRDEPFAGGEPYSRGPWVVVPCRLTVPPEQVV